MSKTAADVLVECLAAWDVNVVFGLPGDGINGIMEALRTRQEDIRFVQVRRGILLLCETGRDQHDGNGANALQIAPAPGR